MTVALVVDDDPFMPALVGQLLSPLDVTTRSAQDGESALEVIRAGGIDVVICDLNMPGMDGLVLLRHLVQIPSVPPLVLFSGASAKVLATAETLAHAHDLTVLGIVEKDRIEELVEVIERLPSSQAEATSSGAEAKDQLTVDEIREGLDRNFLTMHYQPQVDVHGTVVGVEALARWDHPTRGLLGPWAFIDVAERAGLIQQITPRALEIAVRQKAAWQRAGLELDMSVNVTVDDLAEVRFFDLVMKTLREHLDGPSPDHGWGVTLEVTESQLMKDLLAPLEILTRLRINEVGLALDDFGTGASSMQQLSRLPFTELKIDRQFVIGEDADTRAMLVAATDLARALGDVDHIVAEGVEQEDQFDRVCALGCNRIQGYLFAPPLSGARFDAWFVEHRAKSESTA